jgi:hypothetical protein
LAVLIITVARKDPHRRKVDWVEAYTIDILKKMRMMARMMRETTMSMVVVKVQVSSFSYRRIKERIDTQTGLMARADQNQKDTTSMAQQKISASG